MALTDGWSAAERLILWYSPVWIGAVGLVVVLQLFEQMVLPICKSGSAISRWVAQTALNYVLLGVSLSLPCVLLPWLVLGRGQGGLPPWLLLNIWVGIVGFWGNYCGGDRRADVLC
jgi:hypothetical protein